jgi:hypothetical protein
MIRKGLDHNKHLEYAPYSKNKIGWDNAWLYCATCTYDDKYDWRMLTVNEFRNNLYIHGWNCVPIEMVEFVVLPVRDRGPAVT